MRSEWPVLYKRSDKGNKDETSFHLNWPLRFLLKRKHPAGRTGYSVLFVNAFRRATSPPISIASIMKILCARGV